MLPNGTKDPEFNPPELNNAVFSIALQPDGKILVGGDFEGYLTRLCTDGSRDPEFNPPGFDNTVHDIAILPDGKILVGGDFTQPYPYLVRLI